MVWVFYLRWYKFQLSLKAAVDLWSRVELSSAESKTLWVGEGVEKLYENNSILWSSSILYNSILKESSYIERLRLTQKQYEIRFNKSITQYLIGRLHNSINLKSSYVEIQKRKCHAGKAAWEKAVANSIIGISSISYNLIFILSSYKIGAVLYLVWERGQKDV